jgi:FlaA1/EpsC-like NDP-sugar epimerase
MFRERGRKIDGVVRAFDLVALTLAFPAAYFLRDHVLGERYIGQPGLYPIDRYWPLLVLSLACWLAVSGPLGVYRTYRMPTIASEAFRAGRALVVVAAIVAAVGFLTKQADVSRVFVCFYFGASTAMLVSIRVLLRSALRALRRRGYTIRIFAVVGTSEVARRVAEGIMSRREWGYHLAGYIEEDDAPGPRSVGPLIGSLPHLRRLLAPKMLDEIIFAVPHERFKDIEAAVLLCREEGVTARICLDVDPGSSEMTIDELNGIPMLGFYR